MGARETIKALQDQLNAVVQENAQLKLAAALAEKETLQTNLALAQTNLDVAQTALAELQSAQVDSPKVVTP